MGEEQAVVGDHWTEEAVALLERLGWKRHGALGVDVPCTFHRARPKGSTHGLDAVTSYYDPFSSKRVGVIVETKRYAWRNITPARLQEWIDTLTDSLECAPHSEGFTVPFDVEGIPFVRGFLMIECNTPDEYDADKFLEKLRKVNIPKKHADLRIFVACNQELGFIKSLAAEMERLGSGEEEEALFLYPSVAGSNLAKQQALTLEMMFSRFILGITKFVEKQRGTQSTKTRSLVFLRQFTTPPSLDFAYRAAKHFQLQASDALTFYLYEPWEQTRIAEKGFQKGIGDIDCEVNLVHLQRIETVPH